MNTPTRFLILLAAAAASAFAADTPERGNRGAGGVSDGARIVGESGVPGGPHACTRAELVEKMNKPRILIEPTWAIQRDEKGVLTDHERDAHERFIGFVRRNIAAKDKGEKDTPKTLHMTWLEFMNLYAISVKGRENAMSNWSKRPDAPDGAIASNILGVIACVRKKGAEATAAETAFAKEAQEALTAFNAAREGDATDGQRATIKAFVQSLAK